MTLVDLIPEARLKLFFERVHTAVPVLSLALLDAEGRVLVTAGPVGLAPGPLLTEYRKAQGDPVTRVVSSTLTAHRLTLQPLQAHQQVIGFVVSRRPAPAQDADAGIEALIRTHLQDLLDDSLRVESLATEVARTYEEVTLFYRFSRQLGDEHRDLDRLCGFIQQEIETLLPVRYLSVMLVDDKTGELYTRIARDQSQAVIASPRVRLGTIGHLLTRGAPTHVRDLKGHPLSGLVPPDVTEALFVPLVVKTRAVGLLTIVLRDREVSTPDLSLLEAVATGAAVGIENTQLIVEMKDLFVNTVTSFVQAISSKDDYTAGHSVRVSRHVAVVSEEMGLSSHFTEQAVLAALLHDVGKIGTPDAVLGKPTALSEAEWVKMRQHPEHGHTILARVPQLAQIADWVRHEHERYDGQGYPDKLAREAIPLASRIISVTDAFDAMTTDRVYRKGMSPEAAIERIRQGVGSQFDPDVVQAFLSAYQQGKITPQPSSP